MSGLLVVDGQPYCWELRREPQWRIIDGWQGMVIAVRHRDGQREAILQFPVPGKRQWGWDLRMRRPQVNRTRVTNGIRAALASKWEPMSRGKALVFEVDTNGS
ncbi:hypothetical protein OF829_09815 [Sphingomonas sp. LB-2]|uniref:hypothetical protein n=1 Tax=Sphingomonas caeni TaxID=2984949 RepID=UPI002232B503|nr:hypothetical protein [Sphingomonas caeni]MCW3847538.1 hypothetical protein [Sphingomonas caeni]